MIEFLCADSQYNNLCKTTIMATLAFPWRSGRPRAKYSVIQNFRIWFKTDLYQNHSNNVSTVACHTSKKLTNIAAQVVKRILVYSEL